jgi:mono/diheme cytochrome c family protein
MAPSTQDTTVSFARDIRPILERSCTECHGGGESVEMGLDLTSYDGLMAGSDEGTVVEPGKPDESYLIDMVKNGDMPEEGNPLTPEEIDIIRKWIAGGALNN